MTNVAYAQQANDIVAIDKIRTDGGTQPRSCMFQSKIDEYAEVISEGGNLPPVTVFYDGTEYWLADGFHRLGAHKALGLTDIEADIHQGDKRAARLYSFGANRDHGLPRTNEDKRRVVRAMLLDWEWSKWPQTDIAAACGVSQPLVSKMAKELGESSSYNDNKMREVTRNGVTYLQNTANIGKPLPASLEPEVRPNHERPDQKFIDETTIDADNNNGPQTRLSAYSGDNEWYTPARYIELARTVMGQIDVDPASNDHAQKTVKAATFYTAETNGLDKEWHGKVWMNPPYSSAEIQAFVAKIIDEYRAGHCTEAIVLTNNAGDTAWHHSLKDVASRWCVTRGRISFESLTRESGAGAMGQIFFYLGSNPDTFKSVFGEIGSVEMTA